MQINGDFRLFDSQRALSSPHICVVLSAVEMFDILNKTYVNDPWASLYATKVKLFIFLLNFHRDDVCKWRPRAADAFRLRLSCHRWKEREFLFYLSIYLFIYSLCPRLNICIRQDSPVLKIIFYQQLHSTPLDVYTMCYVICTQSYIRFDACPAATSGWLLSGGCGKVCQMFLRFLFSPSRFDVLPPGRDGPHQS